MENFISLGAPTCGEQQARPARDLRAYLPIESTKEYEERWASLEKQECGKVRNPKFYGSFTIAGRQLVDKGRELSSHIVTANAKGYSTGLAAINDILPFRE